MTRVPPWRGLWRYVVGAAVIALLGLRYYAEDRPLLPLEMIELGIHESSHLVTFWAPPIVNAAAGSVGQVLVPLLVGVHLVRRGDPLGGAAGLAWAGLSCRGAAVYIADAPFEDLPLVGGGMHDWAFILGPEGLDRMADAAALAALVRGTGAAMVVAAVVWCLAVPVLGAGGLRWRRRPAATADRVPDWLGPAPPAPDAVPRGAEEVTVFPGRRRPEDAFLSDRALGAPGDE